MNSPSLFFPFYTRSRTLHVLQAEGVHDSLHVAEGEHLAAHGVSRRPSVLRLTGEGGSVIRTDGPVEATLTIDLQHAHHVRGAVVVEGLVKMAGVALNVPVMHEEDLVPVAPLDRKSTRLNS